MASSPSKIPKESRNVRTPNDDTRNAVRPTENLYKDISTPTHASPEWKSPPTCSVLPSDVPTIEGFLSLKAPPMTRYQVGRCPSCSPDSASDARWGPVGTVCQDCNQYKYGSIIRTDPSQPTVGVCSNDDCSHRGPVGLGCTQCGAGSNARYVEIFSGIDVLCPLNQGDNDEEDDEDDDDDSFW